MNKEDFFNLFSSQGESVVEIICLKNNGYYYLKTWISFNLHVCDGKKLKQKTNNKKQSWMNHCCPIYNINLQKSMHMDICAVTILDRVLLTSSKKIIHLMCHKNKIAYNFGCFYEQYTFMTWRLSSYK